MLTPVADVDIDSSAATPWPPGSRRPWWLACALVAASCVRSATTPPPPVAHAQTAAIDVPEGCVAPIEGTFRAEGDPQLRYLAVDDGGTLELSLFVDEPVPADAGPVRRRFARPRDGGLAWLGPRDGGGQATSVERAGPRATVALTRSSAGFRGVLALAADAGCQLEFPFRITACAPDSFDLETVQHHRCLHDGGEPITHRLVRVRADGPGDAGDAARDASIMTGE